VLLLKSCSVCCGSEVASSSVSDVNPYVIVQKLLDSIFNILPALMRRLNIQTPRRSLAFAESEVVSMAADILVPYNAGNSSTTEQP
jgi:hypothetical protein